MFWNDPNLYGATLPYKDFPMQTPWVGPMFGQHTLPRFVPPTFGFTPMVPPTFGFAPQFPQTYGFMPYNLYNMPQVPPMGLNPFVRPFELTQPFYGWNRPLTNIV